jgi:hypothetical protein
MRIEELDALCRQAARDLVARGQRPLAPAVILPLPAATRVTTLTDFPDADPERFDLLAAFARDVMVPANAPAYGFIAEASIDGADVVVAVYGARNHRARVTAARFEGDTLADFSASEELDPAAFPFLAPLQHAAEAARPGDLLRSDA